MSLFLLLISFLVSVYGAVVFFSGYFGAENANQELTAAMTGIAFALIPYIIAKTLAEMVAIRQRHMQIEQTAQFQYLIAEQMGLTEPSDEQSQPAAGTDAPPSKPVNALKNSTDKA